MDEKKEFIIHHHEIIISYLKGIQKILNNLPFVFPNLLLINSIIPIEI